MSHLLNKLLGRDDEPSSHSHSQTLSQSHSSDTRHDSSSTSSAAGGHGNSAQISEGRTVQHEGVSVKSSISSDSSSAVSMSNQQKLNDLVSRLGSTHTQVDQYAKQQTDKINEDTQREIDEVLARTRVNQEDLLRQANEHTAQIDSEYRARLQKMVEEVDATKAKRIADVESELNKKQADILQSARSEIDKLNKKAAQLKIGALQQAQAKAAADATAITAEASNLGQTATVHQSTGTTTIKTEVSAATASKEKGGSSSTSYDVSASSAQSGTAQGRTSETTAVHTETKQA